MQNLLSNKSLPMSTFAPAHFLFIEMLAVLVVVILQMAVSSLTKMTHERNIDHTFFFFKG